MKTAMQAHVLVVDDDAATRKLLRTFLAPLRCTLEEVESGEDALRALDRAEWDVVLLDLGLPGISGFDVLERIRARYTVATLPVVLVTGHDDAASHVKGLELGANDFIAKPVDQSELLARVGTIFAMRWAHLELDDKVRQLQELAALKELLVDYLIPDMRNPLAGARGYLELALDQLAGKDTVVAAQLNKAIGAVDRVAAMATDVLDVSQIENHTLVLKREPVATGPLLHACVEEAAVIAAPKRIQVVGEAGVELPSAVGDRRLIERIVENLLIYAIAHAPDGSRVRLSAASAPAGGKLAVRFAVERTGDPIPAELQPMMFDKYAQGALRRRGHYGVNGLGLAFCRLAAEAMGGTVGIESAPDHPTVLTVTLPAA